MQADKLKLYTLCENTAVRPGVSAEWGYSVLIQAADRTILFDTGSSGAILKNAANMDLDLTEVDTIVLSHGHFDHTGGLKEVLERIGKEVPVIAHPDVFSSKYSYHKKKDTHTYSGIPFRREQLESLGAKFELTTEPYRITNDIVTSGEEEQVTDYENIPDRLRIRTQNGYEPDALADDLSMYIRTDLGLVVVLGCAHRGMVNILMQSKKVMETEEIYMVVGGTHLISADENRMSKTIDALREMKVNWIGTSHCTGFTSAAKLFNAFPDSFFVNGAGSVITFPYKE